MIITITSDSALTLTLSALYRRGQHFSYFTDCEHSFDLIDKKSDIIRLCVIDCRGLSFNEADRMLIVITEKIPNVNIIIIDNNSRFSLKKHQALQISDRFSNEEMNALLTKIPKNHRFDNGIISHDKCDKVLLLGYPLNLTPTEHRILILMSAYPKNIFTLSDISHLIGLKSSSSVTVHICAINKKATEISERPLILSKYSVGYYINPNP